MLLAESLRNVVNEKEANSQCSLPDAATGWLEVTGFARTAVGALADMTPTTTECTDHALPHTSVEGIDRELGFTTRTLSCCLSSLQRAITSNLRRVRLHFQHVGEPRRRGCNHSGGDGRQGQPASIRGEVDVGPQPLEFHPGGCSPVATVFQISNRLYDRQGCHAASHSCGLADLEELKGFPPWRVVPVPVINKRQQGKK